MSSVQEGNQNNNSNDLSQQEIRDLSSLHHYRTEIPNIILEMDLDVYELSLYLRLKRTAGDVGSCFKSNATLCKEMKCEKSKLIETKKSLEQKGLITIIKRKKQDGGDLPDLIEIVDIWPYNMQKMSEKYGKGGGGLKLPGGVDSNYRGGGLKLPKEEPIQEEQKQQQGEHAAVVFSCLKDLEIPHKDKLEICKHYPENRVNHAVAYATNPNIEIKTTLVQTIKWACKEQPEIPKSEEEIIAENKAYVQQLVPKLAKVQDVRGDINNKTVQLTFLTGQRLPFVLSYTEKTFKEQLHKGLVDFGYKIDNLQEKK